MNDFHGLADMLALRAVRREFNRRLTNGLPIKGNYKKVYDAEYERVLCAYSPAADAETGRTETPDA
jgi:hypothetical protein